MNDEGFREIQLNGKQLVFLFMAATVVSVVIFLCGVLVGRGVHGEQAAPAAAVAEVAPDATGARPPAQAGPPPQAAAEPPAPADELTYFDRLQKDGPSRETLSPQTPAKTAAPPPEPPPAPEKPQPRPATPPPSSAARTSPPSPRAATPAVAPPAATEPSGPGFAVQVAAYKDRKDADVMLKRLLAKGYPAFIMAPVKGAPVFYRVRVGKYKSQRDAESVSRRLETEEQFKPWIAR